MTADIDAGTTLRCDESKDGSEGTPTELWESHPRFTVVVDRVEGDYIEATVMRGNSHPRTPDFGDKLALSKESVRDAEKWVVKS